MAEGKLCRVQRRLKRTPALGVFYERGTCVILPAEIDEDMGRPEVITITIIPSDTLNEESEGVMK